MTINLKDFDFGTVDSGAVESARVESSAFQRAGTEVSLPLTGTTITFVENVKSFGVGEGKAKTASGTNRSIKVLPNKFASVVVETDEAWAYNARYATVIFEQQPSAHAKANDAYIAGLEAVPADFNAFGTLAGAQTVEIAKGVEAIDSMDEAQNLLAGLGDKLVLTSGMLQYLKSQRIGTTGVRAFDFGAAVGNSDGTIDGIPYFVIKSSQRVGYLGDYSKLYWGKVTLAPEMANTVKNAGNIKDDSGIEHNLTAENKSALFNEAMLGSAVAGISNFVKIVPAPAV